MSMKIEKLYLSSSFQVYLNINKLCLLIFPFQKKKKKIVEDENFYYSTTAKKNTKVDRKNSRIS